MGQEWLVLSTSTLGLEQLGGFIKFLRPNTLFGERARHRLPALRAAQPWLAEKAYVEALPGPDAAGR